MSMIFSPSSLFCYRDPSQELRSVEEKAIFPPPINKVVSR